MRSRSTSGHRTPTDSATRTGLQPPHVPSHIATTAAPRPHRAHRPPRDLPERALLAPGEPDAQARASRRPAPSPLRASGGSGPVVGEQETRSASRSSRARRDRPWKSARTSPPSPRKRATPRGPRRRRAGPDRARDRPSSRDLERGRASRAPARFLPAADGRPTDECASLTHRNATVRAFGSGFSGRRGPDPEALPRLQVTMKGRIRCVGPLGPLGSRARGSVDRRRCMRRQKRDNGEEQQRHKTGTTSPAAEVGRQAHRAVGRRRRLHRLRPDATTSWATSSATRRSGRSTRYKPDNGTHDGPGPRLGRS